MVKKIKIFCAIVLIVLAIIVHIKIHGTENLVVVKMFPIFPKIQATKVSNLFVKNYLVDVLWFSSFLIFASLFEKRNHTLCALFVAISLEFAQMVFPKLGTFDWVDVCLYLVVFAPFFLLKH